MKIPLEPNQDTTQKELERQIKELSEENAILFEQTLMLQEVVKQCNDATANKKSKKEFINFYLQLRKNEIQNTIQYRIGSAVMKLRGLGILIPIKLIGIFLFFLKTKVPASLGGKSFSKIIAAYEGHGDDAVKNLLNSVKITSTIKANAYTALAKHLQKKDLKQCCNYARSAYKTDPEAYRLKWWILRLIDLGDKKTASLLIQILPNDVPMSQYEKKKITRLRNAL